RQLAAGSPNEKYGIPKGTLFPLVKGGVNTPTAKSACGAAERRRRNLLTPFILEGQLYPQYSKAFW
ncbi:MAG TPA: hypothetical protein VF703_19110, partial [Pyrinomonadaceae bacterium]